MAPSACFRSILLISIALVPTCWKTSISLNVFRRFSKCLYSSLPIYCPIEQTSDIIRSKFASPSLFSSNSISAAAILSSSFCFSRRLMISLDVSWNPSRSAPARSALFKCDALYPTYTETTSMSSRSFSWSLISRRAISWSILPACTP